MAIVYFLEGLSNQIISLSKDLSNYIRSFKGFNWPNYISSEDLSNEIIPLKGFILTNQISLEDLFYQTISL